MEVTFDQHIGIFENAIPPEICNSILDIFNQNLDKTIDRHEEAKILLELEHPKFKPKKNQSLMPYGFREDRSFFLENINEPMSKKIKDFILDQIFPLYTKKYINSADFNRFFIDSVKVQRTLPSEGYHVWHIENSYKTKNTMSRVLAYTVYLDNVEEGGETEFLYQSKRVKPKQGTIVLWPSYFTHSHRGNPPLSGKKHILTGWIQSELPKS